MGTALIGALPTILNGLTRLAPLIIRGFMAAFALLSNPVGWAVILAGVAAALVYYFREDIAKYWNSTFMPAWRKFWSDIGRTSLFESMRDGKLKRRKHGRRTLVLAEDLRQFLEGLPKGGEMNKSRRPPRFDPASCNSPET